MTATQLLAARKRLGLTQKGLAEALGITISAIWRMEKGQRTIETRTELAIKYLLAIQFGMFAD